MPPSGPASPATTRAFRSWPSTRPRHGFTIRDEDVKKQLRLHRRPSSDRNREEYRKGKGQGGQADTAGYALLTLELGGCAGGRDDRGGGRVPAAARPGSRPLADERQPAAVGGQRLHDDLPGDPGPARNGAPEAAGRRIARRLDAVRGWLLEDAGQGYGGSRLSPVGLAGGRRGRRRQCARPPRSCYIRSGQDGGWGQIETQDSDAYATGTALVALHQAGGLATSDPVYARGVAFLLKTQQQDGAELGQQVAQLLSEPERSRRIGELAQACLAGNRGVPARLLSLIEPLLQDSAAPLAQPGGTSTRGGSARAACGRGWHCRGCTLRCNPGIVRRLERLIGYRRSRHGQPTVDLLDLRAIEIPSREAQLDDADHEIVAAGRNNPSAPARACAVR